jgi:hypothetical protein
VTATKVHPFHGAVRKPQTKKHRPAIWECMLGTVYARSPQGQIRYFDYDWDGARAFAEVPTEGDLRLAKKTPGYRLTDDPSMEPSPRQLILWVPK